MTLLCQGIIGFDTHAEVDVRALKTAVHGIAQQLGAKVIETAIADNVTPNFHRFDIDWGTRRFNILCNRHFPVVAFAMRPVDISTTKPIDFPEFAGALSERGFEIAVANQLLRTIEESDLAELTRAEQNQAKYWKPNRIVDLIFNWWD